MDVSDHMSYHMSDHMVMFDITWLYVSHHMA